VKIEDGLEGGQGEEGRQEEADAGGERQRRRVNVIMTRAGPGDAALLWDR
jgi:hypothetical protein